MELRSNPYRRAGAANSATSLSNEEIRATAGTIMPEVGMDGQLKLKNAKVLLIGTVDWVRRWACI